MLIPPIHPQVTAELARGGDFLERVRTARRNVAGVQVTVACPDGDNEIVLSGDGMIVAATFVEDVFDRYPGDELGELLLAMSAEAYAQVASKVTEQVANVLGQR